MKKLTDSRFTYGVGVLLLVALVLRWPFLSGSFWLDEAAQALESARPLAQQLAISADFQPPLFHLVVYVLARFSHQEWWLRLASLAPGLLSIVWTVRLARRRLDNESALVAGAVLTFSALHIFFSQELRPYSLAVWWAVASWDALDRRRWRCLALTTAAGLYTSYVFIFWPLALLVLAVLQRSWRIAWRSLAVSGIFFLAWYPFLRAQLAAGAALRQSLPGWEQVVSLPQAKALLLTITKFLVGPMLVDFTWLYLVVIGGTVAGGGLVLVWLWCRGTTASRQKWLELNLVLILPLLAAWLFSFLVPVVQPKRVLFLYPALALLLAHFWFSRHWAARWLVAVFFVWQMVAIGGYWLQPAWQRENWRSAITTIEDNFSTANTAIIFSFNAPFAPWDWYSREEFTTYQTGLAPLQSLAELDSKLVGMERYRYVIVFDYLRDLTDPYRLIDAYLQQKEYRELGSYTYANLGVIRVWEQSKLYAGISHEPS